MNATQMIELYQSNSHEVRKIVDEASEKISALFLPHFESKDEMMVAMTYFRSLITTDLEFHLMVSEMKKVSEIFKKNREESNPISSSEENL